MEEETDLNWLVKRIEGLGLAIDLATRTLVMAQEQLKEYKQLEKNLRKIALGR